MNSSAMNNEIDEAVRSAEAARSGINSGDWGMVQRLLTEAHNRIGLLLREAGDKSREVMMAPKPDRGDRG